MMSLFLFNSLHVAYFPLWLHNANYSSDVMRWRHVEGHVQIAQVPGRHEPDSDGEINYSYVLRLLSDLGYDGWVGLEYNPAGTYILAFPWDLT